MNTKSIILINLFENSLSSSLYVLNMLLSTIKLDTTLKLFFVFTIIYTTVSATKAGFTPQFNVKKERDLSVENKILRLINFV